ncbi:hypothetical protein D3C80_1090780 [compost metagenome]
MRCPASVDCVAMLIDLDKLQTAGNGFGLTTVLRQVLPNTVVNHEQHLRLNAVVIGINENRALLELTAMCREDQVGAGHHQRMARMNEVGHRFAMQTHMLLFKADALVLLQHRRTAFADHTIPFS